MRYVTGRPAAGRLDRKDGVSPHCRQRGIAGRPRQGWMIRLSPDLNADPALKTRRGCRAAPDFPPRTTYRHPAWAGIGRSRQSLGSRTERPFASSLRDVSIITPSHPASSGRDPLMDAHHRAAFPALTHDCKMQYEWMQTRSRRWVILQRYPPSQTIRTRLPVPLAMPKSRCSVIPSSRSRVRPPPWPQGPGSSDGRATASTPISSLAFGIARGTGGFLLSEQTTIPAHPEKSLERGVAIHCKMQDGEDVLW